MTIHEHLLDIGACTRARNWATQFQFQTAQDVWDNCQRADWLLWWCGHTGNQAAIGVVAKEIADSVKHLRSAADAAYADAADAAAAAAAYADAAAYAAAAAYADAAAAYAAYAAAYAAAAAAAAAKTTQQKLNTEICKRHLKCPWHE